MSSSASSTSTAASPVKLNARGTPIRTAAAGKKKKNKERDPTAAAPAKRGLTMAMAAAATADDGRPPLKKKQKARAPAQAKAKAPAKKKAAAKAPRKVPAVRKVAVPKTKAITQTRKKRVSKKQKEEMAAAAALAKLAPGYVAPGNMKPWEDVWICRAYVNVSCDAKKGADQCADTFWDRVADLFMLLRQEAIDDGSPNHGERHNGTSIRDRFQRNIQKDTNLYNGYYKTERLKNHSGWDAAKYIAAAGEAFKDFEGKQFRFIDCIPILHKMVKFQPGFLGCEDQLVGDPFPTSGDGEDSDEDSLLRDLNKAQRELDGGLKPAAVDTPATKTKINCLGRAMGDTMARPMGQKAAKKLEKAQKKSSDTTTTKESTAQEAHMASVAESAATVARCVLASHQRRHAAVPAIDPSVQKMYDTWMQQATLWNSLGNHERCEYFLGLVGKHQKESAQKAAALHLEEAEALAGLASLPPMRMDNEAPMNIVRVGGVAAVGEDLTNNDEDEDDEEEESEEEEQGQGAVGHLDALDDDDQVSTSSSGHKFTPKQLAQKRKEQSEETGDSDDDSSVADKATQVALGLHGYTDTDVEQRAAI